MEVDNSIISKSFYISKLISRNYSLNCYNIYTIIVFNLIIIFI